ncbi:hypothetical protein D3C81_2280300 [compost metagenome]
MFGQKNGDKVIEKGTLVKMARGEMVRFMAERQISSVEEIKGFNRLDFAFAEELSDESTYVFIQKNVNSKNSDT